MPGRQQGGKSTGGPAPNHRAHRHTHTYIEDERLKTRSLPIAVVEGRRLYVTGERILMIGTSIRVNVPLVHPNYSRRSGLGRQDGHPHDVVQAISPAFWHTRENQSYADTATMTPQVVCTLAGMGGCHRSEEQKKKRSLELVHDVSTKVSRYDRTECIAAFDALARDK